MAASPSGSTKMMCTLFCHGRKRCVSAFRRLPTQWPALRSTLAGGPWCAARANGPCRRRNPDPDAEGGLNIEPRFRNHALKCLIVNSFYACLRQLPRDIVAWVGWGQPGDAALFLPDLRRGLGPGLRSVPPRSSASGGRAYTHWVTHEAYY